MRRYINTKSVISYISAFLLSLFGIVLQMNFSHNTIFVIFAVLSILPILLLIVNKISANQYIKKIKQTKVADMHTYMINHRKEAETASHTLLYKLQKQRHIMTMYTIFLWVLAVCASIFGGMLYYSFSSVSLLPCTLYAGTIFYTVYDRIPIKKSIILNETAPILPKEKYPTIYNSAQRAAETLDCSGEITILLSWDCNASIARDKNKYYLNLGIILLNMLSEGELYCILLHEFSHFSERNKKNNQEIEYGTWLASDKGVSVFLNYSSNIFAFFDMRYLFNHMTYQYATSVVKEIEADQDMAKYGNPQAASSSLLKLNYYDKFLWESGVRDETTFYSTENPNPNYFSEELEKYKTAIAERQLVWNSMIKQEILPNNASHPTLKMRLETIGIKSAEILENNSSSDYCAELQSALEFANKEFYLMQDNYQKIRKEYYLEPLERVEKWKESGMPIFAETYADIISDLKQIGKNEEAEALCDRAIKELDKNSSAHAYFMKGCALLHRYDETGADLIYHALESNNNYIEAGLDEIGSYYCMMGKEKELSDYRARAQELAQKEKDEYSETCFLSKNDNLGRDDMPDDMLKDILAYIHSVDEDIIQNIYLVRKTINEKFFTSAFVIHFYGGTDTQRNEIMHKIFCYLDTYPVEWQFSLFDYFDYPDIKFNKIEGSLVYSKN